MPQTGIFNYPSIDRIVFGEPLIEAVQKEADRLSVERIFVLASGTISRETPCIEDLRATMKGKIAGVFDRLRPHVQRDDVIAATVEARAVQADLILTIGGGTPTDAAKMVSFCLANDVSEYEDLDPLRWVSNPDGTAVQPPSKVPTVRSIFVPTTLSAGEFSAGAGCTDSRRHVKQMFRHPLLAPVVVILDPAICLHTPSGFGCRPARAVDHVVEDMFHPSQPYVEGRLAMRFGYWRRITQIEGQSGRPRRPAELSDRRMDVDDRRSCRREKGGQSRYWTYAGRRRRCAPRLYVLCHVTERPRLERRRKR